MSSYQEIDLLEHEVEENHALYNVQKIILEKKKRNIKTILILLIVTIILGGSISLTFKSSIGSENFFRWVGLAVISIVGLILLYTTKKE